MDKYTKEIMLLLSRIIAVGYAYGMTHRLAELVDYNRKSADDVITQIGNKELLRAINISPEVVSSELMRKIIKESFYCGYTNFNELQYEKCFVEDILENAIDEIKILKNGN